MKGRQQTMRGGGQQTEQDQLFTYVTHTIIWERKPELC